MTTITDLVEENIQYPSRKIYIKRRYKSTGLYESDWVRVDKWRGENLIIDFGSAIYQIDEPGGIIGSYSISEWNFVANNIDGRWNQADKWGSIWWYPNNQYLCRENTKIKIDISFYDENFVEVGNHTEFEGVISKVKINPDATANIIVLSYLSIFNQYPFSDLGLSGSLSVHSIVSAICNQAKITEYMPYVEPSAGYNFSVLDVSGLNGTYWDILQDLAFKSDSIPFLDGTTFKFIERNPVGDSGDIVWYFNGSGSSGKKDLFEITSYDDEGSSRIRTRWECEGNNSIYSESSSVLVLRKYLLRTELVNLDYISSDSEKQVILNKLLSRWEQSYSTIAFRSKYLLNLVELLERISIENRGYIEPDNISQFGFWVFGDDSVLGSESGHMIIKKTVEWKIISIEKNFQDIFMNFIAERI